MKTRWLVIIIGLAASCSPYIPVTEPAYSDNRITEVEEEDITIRLQHLDNQFEHLVFDLEVISHTSAVEILPHHHISYYSSHKPFPLSDHVNRVQDISAQHLTSPNRPLYARSPELMVQMIDRKLKNRATTQMVFALIGAGLVIYDGVKDSKDMRKEKWTSADASKAVARDAAIATVFVASDMAGASAARAAEEAYYLPHELFPDIKLEADESQRGKIFFPSVNNHRYARIIITLPYGDYVFDFKRKSVK